MLRAQVSTDWPKVGKRLTRKLESAMAGTVRDETKRCAADMRAGVAERSGSLRRGIRVETRGTVGRVTAQEGKHPGELAANEYGTSRWPGGHPFVRPAVSHADARWQSAVRGAASKALT